MASQLPFEAEDLESLRSMAADCTRCDLYRDATQTVFGAGPKGADLMLVGEQPGDQEDRQGEPFVGPAGGVLDNALRDAGIARDRSYVTNVVKHFKFTRRGKRRIHQTPTRGEVVACQPWLEGEIAAIAPTVVVLLGATAAKALLGSSFKVTKQRGEVFPREGYQVTATVHPSSILRVPDKDRQQSYNDFVADLKVVAKLLD
ncbi:MAG TPA: UdgX family uracil-DNA binding protein [Euzebyales bacterium]|nr:UdgX family uracil-DNA binding protein [Euzebyales bacterium]